MRARFGILVLGVVAVVATTAYAETWTISQPDVYLKLDGNLTNYGSSSAAVTLETAGNTTYGLTTAYAAGHKGNGFSPNYSATYAANPTTFPDNVGAAGSTTNYGNDIAVNYTLNTSGTITMWYQTFGDHYNYESLVGNSAGADYWEMWLYNNGTPKARIQAGLSKYGSTALGTNTWYNFTWTWNKNSDNTVTQALYVNGNAVTGTESTASWVNPGSYVYFGGNHGNSPGLGTLDEVAIFNTALTTNQVLSIYTNGISTIPEPNTIVLLVSGMIGLLAYAWRKRK